MTTCSFVCFFLPGTILSYLAVPQQGQNRI